MSGSASLARRGAGPVVIVAGAILALAGIWSTLSRSAVPLEDQLERMRVGQTSLVFILIDTLRADRLGSYGYERDTSPHLDGLAEQGIRFQRVRSQSSWTKASMASLWTGLLPAGTGVSRHDDGLGAGATLAAEVLRDAGFETLGVYRNGWVASNFGFDQGFGLYLKPAPGRQVGMERKTPSAHPLQGTDKDAVDVGVEFLRASADERFFLYLHLMDVHQYLYEEDSDLFGPSYDDAYDNAIHWTDRNVGVLIDELERLGLRERTLVVIASDHGEAFREHRVEGHGKNLHAETTSTPLIFSLPSPLPRSLVVEPMVANVDLWPTVFSILGLQGPSETDGVSLVDLLAAAERDEAGPAAMSAERSVFAQLDRRWGRVGAEPRPMISVTRGNDRLIFEPGGGRAPELYRLDSDPGEQVDVAAEDPAAVARLRRLLSGQLSRRPNPDSQIDVELDDMRLGQLRALGYAVEPRTRQSGEK